MLPSVKYKMVIVTLWIFILRQTDKYLKYRVVEKMEAKSIATEAGFKMWKTAKTLAIIAMMTLVTGCQLLIDNRSRESGAVVVVPSDEWDAMRQANLAASQVATYIETDDTETKTLEERVEPTLGSETITFSNYTSSNLGGCIATGIIELKHRGAVDDAITLLKNEAFRLNGNALIIIKMDSILKETARTINIEARLLTCPLKMARGN